MSRLWSSFKEVRSATFGSDSDEVDIVPLLAFVVEVALLNEDNSRDRRPPWLCKTRALGLYGAVFCL
ncbi:hypothetical protein BYT27DRAFT_7186344 [Phlegmacium glaucopus]|nr:hypothetical protein BYT27DRAFT_7186344 [Phlegmacium glaucopus]